MIEDIYDTGLTMKKIIDTIQMKGAKSVKTCTLLHKKNMNNLEYNYYSDYIGFFCPMKFVVGYGMDYNEKMRDMEHLCVISQAGIEKYKQS